MMKRTSLALVAAACLVGPGCTSLPNWGFHRPRFVSIRPIAPPPSAEPAQAARSAYYQSAVRAIDQRDYALALDLLQAARARDPRDAAVVNAFGVVYDKLGRFDLSARY
jgi:Tfp pilus assembly protein PilF